MELFTHGFDCLGSTKHKVMAFALLAVLTQIGHNTPQHNTTKKEILLSLHTQDTPFSLHYVDVLDRSILYMHIAKDKRGEFNVRQKCERLQSLLPDIQRIDDIYNIPVAYHAGLLFTESGCDSTRTSSCNAHGIAQFLKSTGRQYGGIYTRVYHKNGKKYHQIVDKRGDNAWALDASARLLRDLYHEFGDWSLAFAAYHMGSGNMQTLRTLYQNTMHRPLSSIDQLYGEVPSQEVISFLASKDDDTFGYWIKIKNAWTLYQLYDCDRATFDAIEQKYAPLSYDLRGIVAQDVVGFDHIHGDTTTLNTSFADTLCVADDVRYVDGVDMYEKTLSVDAYRLLSRIEKLFGHPISVSCGTLSVDDIRVVGDTLFATPPQKRRRYMTHTSGRVFDIVSPRTVRDIQRLEYVLTILRYDGAILRCRESDIDNHIHYHIVVLTQDPYDVLIGKPSLGKTVVTK